MNKKRFTKKVLYFTGVCGIALTSLAPMASPFINEGQTVQAVTVNDGKTYQVNIHKYASNEKDGKTSHDGTEIVGGLTTHTALGGIKFTLTEVDTAGIKIKDLKVENAKDKANGKVVTETTGKDGIASFKDLPKGIYKVHETEQKGIEPSADFLVQLPMTKVDGTGYLDTVNIYPKNKVDDKDQKLNLDKMLVDDKGAQTTEVNATVGTTLKWNVSAHVPSTVVNGADATKFGKFYVLDPIRKSLTLDKNAIVGMVGGVQLDKNDFTVTDIADDGEAQGVDNFKTVKIELTNSGLTKTAGKDVVFTLSTKIDSLETFTQEDVDAKIVGSEKLNTIKPINNTVTAKYVSTIDGIKDIDETTVKKDHTAKPGDGKDKPALPDEKPDGNGPQIHIGRVDILKVDADDEATKLEGAEFKIALSEKDAKDGKFVKATDGMVGQTPGKDIVLKTNKDGVANILGLTNEQTYYMVETQAPKGYNLTDEVFKVTAGENTGVDATVKDTTDVIAKYLPVTGGQFKLILSVLGLAVVAGASTAFYVNYRKKEQA